VIVTVFNSKVEMSVDTGSMRLSLKILKRSGESVTRQRVRDLRSLDSSMTMAKIGKQIGISRQRVYWLLRDEGLPTKHLIDKRPRNCYECPVCGTISRSEFCSDECKNKWTLIPIICSGCGKLFFRSKRILLANYRHCKGFLFCSKQCTGNWLREQYGFERYPEHKGRKRKYNWDAVWKAHIETGYGHKQLSKLLGIPSATIASILYRYRQKIESYE
jgi:hypothetical protein